MTFVDSLRSAPVEPVESAPKGAYYVFSGSGSRLPAHAGAYSVLSKFAPGLGFAGASGGGLIALSLASGMDLNRLNAMLVEFLTQDLLDLSLTPWDRFGLYKGDKIYRLLTDVFGDQTMRDLQKPCRITTASLHKRQRVLVTTNKSDKNSKALVRDVAACTIAIPIFFKARRLFPNDGTLYVDGGTVDNFPVGVFDLFPAPTYGLRFVESDDTVAKPVRNLAQYAAALFDLRQDAANQFTPSIKSNTQIVDLHTKHDGLDFKMDPTDVMQVWDDGAQSAMSWLSAHKPRKGTQ
jgi:predicted acylesterase/phospholipase RssA